jgi:hypothetical protein
MKEGRIFRKHSTVLAALRVEDITLRRNKNDGSISP